MSTSETQPPSPELKLEPKPEPKSELSPELTAALCERLTELADDELILAHRNGEWVAHAPILEEDIAIANLAQDELGHAQTWLELRSALDGCDPDKLAFFRNARQFRNVQLCELPRGDWAFTMMRQCAFDAYEALWLEAAQQSKYEPLAQAAGKMLREEKFHLQHSAAWLERLGLGTGESRQRLESALPQVWSAAGQLFEASRADRTLQAAGITPDLEAVRERWLALMDTILERAGFERPDAPPLRLERSHHTENLVFLLSEMQSVAREFPDAQSW